MSKEQTPLTAEEIIRQPKYNELKNLILICEAMDEFANAKVLEALEREFSKLDGIDFSLIGGTEYYETEVKPKYE